MGRHSASDDEDEAVITARLATPAAAPTRSGRHARSDEDAAAAPGEAQVPIAERDTERIDIGLLEAVLSPEVEPEPPDAVPDVASVPRPAPAPPSTPPPSTSPPSTSPPSGKGSHSTAADLALLRQHSDVRARVVAAVVVPFVLYTAVMYLIGALNVYLIWVWIPLVTAGVLGGSILDAEHRRRAGSAPDS
jgi:hypothetical protein